MADRIWERPTAIAEVTRRHGIARLPSPLTALVGRDAEVGRVAALLTRDDVRLMTLTGPGGVGKTRLAIAVGAAVGDAFADGVAWVPLAEIREPDAVPDAIARATGAVARRGETVPEALRAGLADSRMLLVLDNLEQVLEVAPLLTELLVMCPGVVVLATSRVPLRIAGERRLAVEPLSLRPEAGAVRLFTERAQAIRPDFALTGATAGLVGEICRQVDGLPLAIELAAARLSHLDLASLAERLQRRLPTLRGGASDAPNRHRTIQDAIDWSHDLLTPAEQVLFRRLAVFHGGFTLDAAERVGAGVDAPRPERAVDGDGGSEAIESAPVPALPQIMSPRSTFPFLPSVAVLDVLGSLIEKSLVRYEPGGPGGPRYAMLETVREYAAERLSASGEADRVRDRHADWCLAFAEAHEFTYILPAHRDRLPILWGETPNLRATMGRLEETGATTAALRLGVALYLFWQVSGQGPANAPWLERVLERATSAPVLLAARARCGLAYLAARRPDVAATAARHAAEGQRIVRAFGDPAQIHTAAVIRGVVATEHGDDGLAESCFSEAVTIAASIPDSVQSGIATADALGVLGDLAQSQGRQRLAAERYARALDVYETSGDRWGVLDTLLRQGDADRDAGARTQAAGWYARCFDDAWPSGEALIDASALTGAAWAALMLGEAVSAARLLGAAREIQDRGGISARLPVGRDAGARAVATSRAVLGADAFAAAWAEGSALSPEQTAVLANRVIEAIDSPTDPLAPTATSAVGVTLSRREREILPLLAAGASNRAIAEALFISERTVDSHVARLFAKLDVHSRVEAITVAVALGLLELPTGRTNPPAP